MKSFLREYWRNHSGIRVLKTDTGTSSGNENPVSNAGAENIWQITEGIHC